MRDTAFYINGGAGRVIASIPALEKFAEENPKNNFIIVCEGGMDFYKGHPVLHDKAYDVWHKNLFQEKLINRDIVSPEPYRIWEYFNQQCNISQAFDLEINKKGLRSLPSPTLKLSQEEIILGQLTVNEVKDKLKKEKVIVFQPFGRTLQNKSNVLYDSSGRSFEYANVLNIIKKLQKKYAVILMSEVQFEFEKEGVKDPVAQPVNTSLRQWAGIIKSADHFVGCDSVGQHIAYSLGKTATVVLGSTYAVNVSYPDHNKFDILDMGEGLRKYSPIRLVPDEVIDRNNDGIMSMNDKIEDVIVESVNKMTNLLPTPELLITSKGNKINE
jgi:hypothetical protein